MFVHSLAVSNVLSFGPQQQLNDLRQFNLLIGKNGSGKSNTFRILGDLGYTIRPISVEQPKHHTNPPTFRIELENEFKCDRTVHHQHERGNICIDYTDGWGDAEERRSIVFRNGRLVAGDVRDLERNRIVLPNWDDASFSNSIQHAPETPRSPLFGNAILDFGLTHVFGGPFAVLHPGFISEYHTRYSDGEMLGSGGVCELNRDRWSDGMLQVAKIIQQVKQQNGLCLLEEPELHLEPRALRRFIQLLFWLKAPPKQGERFSETSAIENEWQEFVDPRRGSYDINEKEWKECLRSRGATEKDGQFEIERNHSQLFISSHSPIVLREVLKHGECAAVYEFDSVWKKIGHNPSLSHHGRASKEERDAGWVNQETRFTEVRRIATDYCCLLNNLGCNGADLLQCNGVVWVEGPSDVIFIDKWLHMYAVETKSPQLDRGINFEFQMYGGAILDRLCLIKDGLSEGEEQKKLIEMFSFSRNAYIIADSDAKLYSEGIVRDASTYFRAKQFLVREVARKNSQGYRLGIWYAENNTELRTIEDYVDEGSMASVAASLSKTVRAQRIVANWADNKRLDDFPLELRGEIGKLYDTISSWQD